MDNEANKTMEEVQEVQYKEVSKDMAWLTAVCSIITIATIMGNIAVIFTILSKANLRRLRPNLFVLSLTVTDLIIGIVALPLEISRMHQNSWTDHQGEWIHNSDVCHLWLLADIVACTASIWNLAAIAIDRLLAVVRPITYMSLTRTSAVCLILAVWVVSICICVPSMKSINYDLCRIVNMNIGHLLLNSLLAFYLPLVIIVACYSVVFWLLKRKFDKKVIAKMERLETLSRQTSKAGHIGYACTDTTKSLVEDNESHRTSNTLVNLVVAQETDTARTTMWAARWKKYSLSTATTSITSSVLANAVVEGNLPSGVGSSGRVSFSYVNSKTGKSKLLPTSSVVSATFKREKRVLIQMAVLVLGFVICWLPFWMLFSAFQICWYNPGLRRQCNFVQMSHAMPFVQWLGYLNSLINPILYTGFNKEFRKAFKDVLSCSLANLLTSLLAFKRRVVSGI